MREALAKIAIKLRLKRPPLPPQRHIPLGPVSKSTFVSPEYSLEKIYGDNEITTSRYTWYGFLFQNLMEQAQRIANFYFICIAIVQLFTDTPVTPAISILPLVFVFTITMVKQGYEDWLRHKSDREVNNLRLELVTEEGRLKTVQSKEISVGDIVLCRANDTFPCDLLLLSSSEHTGECFVTTASLDGETNLKRFVATDLTKIFDSPDLLAAELKGTITCQQPVDDLYDFSGRISVDNSQGDTSVSPIGPTNLLLRGTCLRNTDFIYGCAVYTGQDTKMMLNSKGKKTKFSQVERKLNLYLAFILCLLVACATISTILSITEIEHNAWYVTPMKITAWAVIQDFLGFIVLYNYIIPISLYVTIEVQKFFGSMFFEWDTELYDSETNEKAKVNTSDLLEEMGQIEYLFTDKTGTLTENCMKFCRFATALGIYGIREKALYRVVKLPKQNSINLDRLEMQLGDAVELSPSTTCTEDADDVSEMDDSVKVIHTLLLLLALCHTVRVEKPVAYNTDESIASEASKRKHRLHKRQQEQKQQQLRQQLEREVAAQQSQDPTMAIIEGLRQFREPPKRGSSALRRASAAQSATAAVRASRRGRKFFTEDYIYQASSPDEKAFVETSRDLGVVFHGLDESGMHVVTLQGVAARYRLLDVLEFDATRKCMTIILQPVQRVRANDESWSEEAPVLILCKGAETAMIERSSAALLESNEASNYPDPICQSLAGRHVPTGIGMPKDVVLRHVTDFASSGLRTLVMGARVISASEWHDYKADLDQARGQLDGRDAALGAIYAKIESQFILIGCTGVEDMLQAGVPETIEALREAGIQIWVLTGDKEETAVNISYAAGHFYQGMQEIRITKCDSLHVCLTTIQQQSALMVAAKAEDENVQFGLVVDGQSLHHALDSALRDKFSECCLNASTVLCCRCTPLQKSEVVHLIKGTRSPEPVTAAIGDGANDVSMILEAHVSFGLFGKEGRQAVRAADYAFSRFRFLRRAILFHGHTYYVRVATLVLYFFYKNLLFTLPQMLYGFFCTYSAQTIYPEIYLVLFNITMTSLPIFLYGLFEKPVPEEILLRYPQLYRGIVRNSHLSRLNLIFWLSSAVWHAFTLFFGVYFLAFRGQAGGTASAVSGAGGSGVGEITGFGNLLTMAVFITVNVKIFIFSYYINWVVIVGGVIAFFLNLMVFTFLNFYLFPVDTGAQLFGTWTVLWGGAGLGLSWLGLLILSMLALLPDLVLRNLADQGWQWKLDQLIEDVADRGASTAKFSGVTHTEAKTDNNHMGDMDPGTTNEMNYINPSFEWPREERSVSIDQHAPRKPPTLLPVEELFVQGPIEDLTQSSSSSRPRRLIDMIPPDRPTMFPERTQNADNSSRL